MIGFFGGIGAMVSKGISEVTEKLIEAEKVRTLDKARAELVLVLSEITEVKINKEMRNRDKIRESNRIKKLREIDKVRADIKEYDTKMLTDVNRGHWDLWDGNEEKKKDEHEIDLKIPLVARDPRIDIVDGIVAIDFGTKSTVVVRQKDNYHNLPMRVGVGDVSKREKSKHYENPTILEFIDYKSWRKNYNERIGRPHTKWEDLTVSHEAYNSMLEGSSKEFSSFFSRIKQWCAEGRKIKLVDKQDETIEFSSFENKGEEVDPIEIYAYYLGMYINNMYNGIHLKYYLSFPVTYEIGVRDKIRESFTKGIRKSLPESILKDEEVMVKFEVNRGASEPAAYAITALKEYGFEPIDDEKNFYGVFDFGGGTTDFDFGIWRESNGAKERRFDYVIEHFGAGGDRYLGGENLLELLTYEVFKKNRDILRENEIGFVLPPECREFLGSEILLSDTREAHLNMRTLMDILRPLWEKHEGFEKKFQDGVIKVDLWKQDGTPMKKLELTCNTEELEDIIRKRIEKGVENFFNALRLAFNNSKVDLGSVEKINIFLAGNSSKASVVEELFREYMKKEENKMNKNSVFEIFPTLGTSKASEVQKSRGIKGCGGDIEAPNGKTGVAFGLIESRKGSKIKVVDHNVVEEINFKFYLGEEKKGRFKVIIDREVPYGEWIEFIDAGYEDFEILYSDNPRVTTNRVDLRDSSIKKKSLKIDNVDEGALVYLRKVSPKAIEYVVAVGDELESEGYRGKITRIEIA